MSGLTCHANNCAKEADFACGGCHLVYYCSSACQKTHWHSHRDMCKTAQATKCTACHKTPPEAERAFILCSITCPVFYCSDSCKERDKISHYLSHPHPINAITYIEQFTQSWTLEATPVADLAFFALYNNISMAFRHIAVVVGPTDRLSDIFATLRQLTAPSQITEFKNIGLHLAPSIISAFEHLQPGIPTLKRYNTIIRLNMSQLSVN